MVVERRQKSILCAKDVLNSSKRQSKKIIITVAKVSFGFIACQPKLVLSHSGIMHF